MKASRLFTIIFIYIFTLLPGEALCNVFIFINPNAEKEVYFATSELKKYLPYLTSDEIFIFEDDKISTKSLALSSTHNELIGVRPPKPELTADSFLIEDAGEFIEISGSTPRSILYASYELMEYWGLRWPTPSFAYAMYPAVALQPDSEGAFPKLSRRIEKSPSFPYREAKAISHTWKVSQKNGLLALIDWMGKQKMNVLGVFQGQVGELDLEVLQALAVRGIDISASGHSWPYFYKLHSLGNDSGKVKILPRDMVLFSDDKFAPEAEVLAKSMSAWLPQHKAVKYFAPWGQDNTGWPLKARDASGVQRLIDEHSAGATLFNQLSKKMGNNGVVLQTLAYQKLLLPPVNGTSYPEGTQVFLCPINRDYSVALGQSGSSGNKSRINRTFEDAAVRWNAAGYEGRLVHYTYYTKFSWHSLPFNAPLLIRDEITWMRWLNFAGAMDYFEPESWMMYDLQHYVLAKLLWDANLDVRTLTKDYFTALCAGVSECGEFFAEWHFDLEMMLRNLHGGGYFGFAMRGLAKHAPRVLQKALGDFAKFSSRLDDFSSQHYSLDGKQAQAVSALVAVKQLWLQYWQLKILATIEQQASLALDPLSEIKVSHNDLQAGQSGLSRLASFLQKIPLGFANDVTRTKRESWERF